MKAKVILCLALVVGAGLTGRAQTAAGSNSTRSATALMTQFANVFDLSKPFSATAEVSMDDPTPLKLTAGLWVQDGNVRVYVDTATMTMGSLPPDRARQVLDRSRKLGLSRHIVLLRDAGTTRYTIYPDRRVYHTNDFQSLLPAVDLPKAAKFKEVLLGDETVGGHACRKLELQMSDGGEAGTVLTIWRAKDLDGFPVRIQLREDLKIDFRQIKFAKLDPALFEVPSDYRRMNSIGEIMEEALGQNTGTAKVETKAETAARVFKWEQDLAEKGESYGEYRMGVHYRDGDAVPKDLDKARDWLQKAADQGNSDAVLALQSLPPPPAPWSALKPEDRKVSDILILSTAFGLRGHFSDVTARLVELLRTQPDGFVVNVGSLHADPLPGKTKRLTIMYEYKGSRYSFTIQAQKRLSYEALVKYAQK